VTRGRVTKKSLVIAYQYVNPTAAPQIAICKEGESLSITNREALEYMMTKKVLPYLEAAAYLSVAVETVVLTITEMAES
jgi:hypothetical protein